MTLELSLPAAASQPAPFGSALPASQPAPRPTGPSPGHTLLALAWHNVADASRRLDRLQERLAALVALPADSPLI